VTLDLSRPLVYLITKGECESENYADASRQVLDIVSAAVRCGVDLIQIREKKLTGKLLFDLTQRAVELVGDSRTKVLVNDRVDIALAAGADGVHLTSRSVVADVVRSNVDDGFLIGVSCHTREDIAATHGADFLLFGPVFASPGKGEGVGSEALRAAVESSELPVIGIGGIDETNYKEVVDAGAAGFAAIRALNDICSMRLIMEEPGR
jgi:thiamine-phosphate pyrophosphorylase